MLKVNKLRNNCTYIELDKIIALNSYESIIGFVYKDIMYISEYYLNYSRTTTKHINLFKENIFHVDLKIISNNDLYLFFSDITINNKDIFN